MSQHHRDIGWSRIARTLRPRIAASLPQPCIRCGRIVTPDMAWDVGHRVDLAMPGSDPWDAGPEHRRCNRSAGGKAGAAKTNASRRANRRMPQW